MSKKYGDKKKINGKIYTFHGLHRRKERAQRAAKQTRSHPSGFYCTIVKVPGGYEEWVRKK